MTDTNREAQHTPLPWACGPTGGRMAKEYLQGWAVTSHGGVNLVAGCFSDGRNGADGSDANAAFIVRACNSHYLLTESLRECVDVLTDPVVGTVHHDDPDWYMRLDKAVTRARAALSQAGGASD